MALRILLAVLALAAVGWAVGRERAVGACDEAARASFQAAPAEVREVVEQIREHCRGTAVLASAATLLEDIEPRDVAPRLAAEAVEREPSSLQAWRASRTIAIARGDVRGAVRAEERLRALDRQR